MSQFPRAVLRSLLLGALLLSPSASLAATTYYVSPSGADTNPGTQASPFRQIRRALQSMGAGDTALVADGSYLGFNIANKNGTAGAPITVKALGTGAQVTPTTDRVDNRDTIFITFSSYLVIDGLSSFNANRAAVRIDESPHTTVRNGVFGNNAVWGIFTDFSDDLLLEYNECYGSIDQHGIYVSNSGDRPVVRGNICHDNHDCGIQWNADVSMGGDGIISGGLLENNVCYNNGTGGGAALNLDGVQDTIVRNNLLFNNHASGLVCYVADGAAGPHGMVIVHNTIDMPASTRWCVNMGMTTGPNLIRNNILINRDSYRGCIDYYTPDDLANTDSDYNVLAKITTDDGDTITTLAQLKALGKELPSIAATPTALWANPAPDYHLKTGAPAVDIGDNANSAPKDLDGQTRPQGTKVDLGCYEQAGVAPPDVTPPAAPTGLALTPGNTQIGATWNANGEPDLAGYNVYRATAVAGPFTKQNGNLLGSPALTQTGLTNGQTYLYRVTAVDTSGNESSPSETKSATPVAPPDVTPPGAPTGLALTPGNGQIGLVWNGNSEPDLAGYNVYRATAAAGPFSKQNGGLLALPSLTQVGLTNGQTHWYCVTAVDSSGNESAPSETKSATPVAPPDTTAPVSPTGLTATAGDRRVVLSWNANTESDLAGYYVYRATSENGTYTRQNATPLAVTTLTQTGLTNGQTYWYYVTAVDTTGNESGASAKRSATPTAPAALVSLTFNPTSVLGGQSSQGTVTLSAPAPAGGAVVALKSGNNKVTVPVSVTVPSGALTATFTAKTQKVAARRDVTVTATYNGVSKSATLTLRR